MKNQLKYILRGLIILFLVSIFTQAQAQFAVASYGDVALATAIKTSDNTGNDIMDFNGDLFEVTVSEDLDAPLNSGLAYSVNGIVRQFIPFSYPGVLQSAEGYLDPDVCLITDGTYIYALAVYLEYEPGSNYENYYILECFRYDYDSEHFISLGHTILEAYGPTLSVPLTSDFEVNIDAGFAESENRFVTTWNDQLGYFVSAWEGMVGEGECATMCGSSHYIYDIFTRSNNAYLALPDVALNNYLVYFTYLIDGSPTSQGIEVVSVDLYELCESDPDPSILFQTSPSYFGDYRNPRIACPNSLTATSGADDADFHVVAEETDYNTMWGILGINYFNGSGSTYINYYNDGTTGNSPTRIDDIPNYNPVVTYSEDGNIIVGWLIDNKSAAYVGNAVDALYPIAINCDPDGKVTSGADYMNVPNSAVSSDEYTTFSVAGRFASATQSNLYSFLRKNDECYSKVVSEGSSNLRLSNSDNQISHKKYNLISMLGHSMEIDGIDLEGKEFVFQLFDMMNREVVNLSGDISKIRREYKNLVNKASLGVYYGSINAVDGSIYSSGKILALKQ